MSREVRARSPLRRRPLLVAVWAALARATSAPARRRAAALAGRASPLAAAVACAAAAASGALSRPAPPPLALLTVGAAAFALAASVTRRARRAAAGRSAGAVEELELGALAVALATAGPQLAQAPLATALAPVAYLVLAAAGASCRRRVSAALALLGAGVAAAAWQVRGAPAGSVPPLLAHALLCAASAALGRALLGARLAAAGRAERAAVARRLATLDERARAFRVLGGAGEDGADPRARAGEAAVVEIEAAVRGALEVAEVALRAHTVAAWLASPDDRVLSLLDCRSASDGVVRRPIPAGEGLAGAAFRARRAVRLDGRVDAGWYEDGTRAAAALAVPILDPAGRARGVLLADRVAAEPFDARDERLLATLAGELLRAIESERLLADVRRARDESERFFQAIERLNRTAKAREAYDALLAVAGDVAPVDFGAVTLTEEGASPGAVRHRIVRVRAGSDEGRETLEGKVFDDGTGLVASAVRLAASLPGRELDPAHAVVFDEATRLHGLASIKVLPLRSGDRVLGTLVVGARRRGAYAADAARQLEVVALQAADAILRARLFDETERLATVDGLTGLVNHRAFQVRFDEQLALAARYGRPLALVLCDVDHFKRVNDAHGHPAGDEVLRGVARLLAREARACDVVARYGGEEFAVLLPETDAEGARVVAERMRVRVAAAPFATPAGPVVVTISGGIAAFPASGRAKPAVLEAADQALYASKRAGRDRMTVAAGAARRDRVAEAASGVQRPPGAC